jgi:hypothetical protein
VVASVSYAVGDSVKYLDRQWHVYSVNPHKQTVELCDKILLHKPTGINRCLHAEITFEKLAAAEQDQGSTRADWIKQMLDSLAKRGVEENDAVRKIVESVASEAEKISEMYSQGFSAIQRQESVRINYDVGTVRSLGEFYKQYGSNLELAREEMIDARYGQNKCYGFSLLYSKPNKGHDDELIQYGSDYAVEMCDSLEACWTMVDYLVDSEEGLPVAIRDDLKVVYYQEGGRWLRNRDEYDEVPEAYVGDADRGGVVQEMIRDEVAFGGTALQEMLQQYRDKGWI